MKPLFYSESNGGLIFASEIKTIFCHPAFRPELDLDGAYQLLLLGPGRVPGSGVFHGIRELEPGWYGYFENHRLTLTQYWKLRDRYHRETFEET